MSSGPIRSLFSIQPVFVDFSKVKRYIGLTIYSLLTGVYLVLVSIRSLDPLTLTLQGCRHFETGPEQA